LTSYDLRDKLLQLEELTQEAVARKTSDKEELIDVWRPNLDLSTAYYSKSVPAQRQRVTLLEQELINVETENAELYASLENTMADEQELRMEAVTSLDSLQGVSIIQGFRIR
jgi:hypothetical protein